MFLGIEIGGTKLQLGVGDGARAHFEAFERYDVIPKEGAQGILRQIEASARNLSNRFNIERVGFGFGGPVDGATGRVITSHQIEGWTDCPLVDWVQETLELPAVLGNDCDCAALAEARYGAGQGHRTVFYITVGTGVGGGLVIDGHVHGTDRPAVAEIGHLRPGLPADDSHATVESLASGWGIAATARAALQDAPTRIQDRLMPHGRPSLVDADRADLLERCGGDVASLTTLMVGKAAAAGNQGARAIIRTGTDALGWAVAQMIALVAPEVVVIGGGVSLMGEELFLNPVREAVGRYVFPPLADACQLTSPQLGEEVVVHGAVSLGALSRR
ncbi:MAG: ROK family protein [Planctomycetaceae bacterium]|nr:ROK family protein [Planctomycetaceae bacterium]